MLKVFTNERLNHIRADWMHRNEKECLRSEQKLLSAPTFETFEKVQKVFEHAFGTDGKVYYYDLISAFEGLVKSNSLDLFMHVPKDRAKIALMNIDTFYKWSVRSYLKTVILLESKGLSSFSGNSLNDYITEDFEETLNAYSLTPGESVEAAVLYSLKIVYDEKFVIELLQRIIADRSEIPFDELMELLKDWQNMREYPLEWAVTFMSENTEDVASS